jgi:hypothetical protein
MKRDMDLVRQILLEMERRSSYVEQLKPITIEGRSDEEVSYHIMLLHEAGLMEASGMTGGGRLHWIPQSLTWEGHEFLDAARDDTRWNKMKVMVKEKAGAVGFEVVKQVLVVMARQAMGL